MNQMIPVEETQYELLNNETPLSPEDTNLIEEYKNSIDLTNTNLILQYGVNIQKKVADFSENTLSNVKTKDFGELGGMLSEVVMQLRDFENVEEQKGFFGLFKKTGDKVANLKLKYEDAATTITKIVGHLETHQRTLLKDISILDQMYEYNKDYFKELTLYIQAGKEKLETTMNTELHALKLKAEASGLPEDAQAANDLAGMCNRFEKKIHDLELTRAICIQTAPQIRLVQNNDSVMAEKIQSTIINTIPLWKSQMVLALGIAHSQQAMLAQREVTDMTNEMLKKNAQMLKMSTIETAKEAERGIIDMETLQETNATMISTLDEVIAIQKEGRTKRQNAELELKKLENDLKTKLLSL